MKLVGLINPITVQMRHWRIHLVAGRHRFEAARRLKWAEIMAVELPASDDKPDNDDLAAMAQIAENLHRREIGEIERAELIEKWAELRDERNNKLRKQSAVSKRGNIEGRGNKGGIRATARDLGVDEKTVRNSLKIASLSLAAKDAAKASGLDNNQSALLEAAKHKEPVRQVEVIKKRQRGSE